MSKSKTLASEQKLLLEQFSENDENVAESESESITDNAVVIEKPKRNYEMTPAREAALKRAHEKNREKGQKSREEAEAKKLQPKPKRILSEAQKEVLKNGQEINLAKKKKQAEERIIEEQILKEEQQKKYEELIVKKAIAIKKKQIKKESALEEISDDDTPVEKIKEIIKKTTAKKTLVSNVKEPTFYEKYKFV